VDVPDYSLAASCDDLKSIVLLGFGLLGLFPWRTAVFHLSNLCM